MLLSSTAHLDALTPSDRGGGGVIIPSRCPCRSPSSSPAVVRSVLDAFSSLTGGQSSSVPPEPRSFQQTGPSFPPSQSEQHPAASPLRSVRPDMKQTLSELMRMSRICRMVFATCLGSFILVIFYFQSMFQPGRIFHCSLGCVCVCV